MKNLVLFLLFLPGYVALGQLPKFSYKLSGQGNPTIVVVTAMGEDSKSWKKNQQRLSSISSVVTYDRLGLGKSATTDVPRTIENMSIDLDVFLTSSKINGPYLLIGHSLGSFIIRKYQHNHPQNVLGMILIDPVHENQFDSLMSLKNEEEKIKSEQDRQSFVNSLPDGQRKEAILYHEQRREMENVKFPRDIPITILATFRVGQGATEKDRRLKRRLIESWIRNAPQIRLVATENSGHYIQDDEPDLLIREVKSMISALRNR